MIENGNVNGKNTKNSRGVNSLNEDDVDEVGFVDNPKIKGEKVSHFSFGEEKADEKEKAPEQEENKRAAAEKISKDKEDKVINNIRNNETFKRSYMLTQDCIRKIETLKAIHPSLTTYLSDIVEFAVDHYYEYMINKKD